MSPKTRRFCADSRQPGNNLESHKVLSLWNSTAFQNFSAVFINALIRAARPVTRLPALPRLGRREVFFCFLEQPLEFRFARPNERFDSQILRILATLMN